MVLSNENNIGPSSQEELEPLTECICFKGTPAGDALNDFENLVLKGNITQIVKKLVFIHSRLSNSNQFFGDLCEFDREKLMSDFIETLKSLGLELGLPHESISHFVEATGSSKTHEQKIFHKEIFHLAIKKNS